MALLNIFGELAFPQLDVRGLIGREKMLGSKLIRSVKAEGLHESIGDVIGIRFGEQHVPIVVPLLEQIGEPERLRGLLALATRCAGVDEFLAGLKATHPARATTRHTSRKPSKAK